MPEFISRPLTGDLPKFRSAEGKGGIFTPPPKDVKKGEMRAHAVQTILVAPQALYELWREVEASPLWMEYVISVEAQTDTVSRWLVGDPYALGGKRIEYDVEIIADQPGKCIAWESITDSVDENGEVTFEPSFNGRGTLVTMREFARIPASTAGHALAAVIRRSPRQIVTENLRHFKQLAESGEIPSVEGQPSGPRGFSGSLKSRMYGENNPTPPGTSGLA